MLSELIDREIRDVVLKLDLNNISDSLVDKTVEIVERNKGKHSLVLSVVDTEKKYKVDLLSRKLKVDISEEFINEINSLNTVALSIS